MSDSKFSLDDILNEYSNKHKNQKEVMNSEEFEEFLDAPIPKKATEKNIQNTTKANDELKGSIDKKGKKQFVLDPIVNKNLKEMGSPQKATYLETTQGLWINPPEVEKRKREKRAEESIEKDQEKPADKVNDVLFQPSLTTESDQLKFQNTPIKPIRKTSGNTAIIENLLRIKKEQGTVQKNADIPPINRKGISDIELDIKHKLIPKTELIEMPENASEEEKIKLLKQRRNKKIRDFVLFDDDEDETDEEEVFDPTVDDFTCFDQTTMVFDDIYQLKGTLIVRMCFLIITSLFSIFIAVANDLGWPLIDLLSVEKQPTSYLFVSIVLGILSIFVSYTVIQMGISRLFRLEADSDSVTAVTVIASVGSALLLLANPSFLQQKTVHIYIPVAILSLLINTIGKLMILSRTERNFKFVSGEFDKHAVVNIDDENLANKLTKGAINDFPHLSTNKRTEFVNDFLKNSYSADIADRYSKIFLPILIIGGLITTLISFLLSNQSAEVSDKVFIALSTFAGTVGICSSMALMLIVNIPLNRASKKYLSSSAVMLGYSAVDEFAGTNSVLIDSSQLFPEGMVEIINLKPTSTTSIEEGILLASSLACYAGSILEKTFFKMLKGKTEMLYPVESYIYEDSLGISGWIENKRVLLGTRELMKNHSIEGLPTKAKEADYAKGNHVLYLSVSGVIATIFFVRVSASVGVRKWMGEFERNNLTVVIRSVDGFVSLNLLSDLFGISPNMMKLLPFRFHSDYHEATEYTPCISSSMLSSGRFHSFATLIVGAKRLYRVCSTGISLTVASSIVGGVIALIMTLLKSFNDLSSTIIIAYNLAWISLTLLVQRFRKV